MPEEDSMGQRRTLLLSTLCALAVPSFAFAHGGAQSEPQQQSSTNGRAPSAGAAQPAPAAFPLTTQQVNTRMVRDLGNGCRYATSLSGSYRTTDVAGQDLRTPVRDVDITAENSITCGQRIVRRDVHRLLLPRVASEMDMLTLLHARMTSFIPASRCAWTPVFDINGGAIQVQAIYSNCSVVRQQLALVPYGGRFAYGGGPRVINGRTTLPSAYNYPALPHEPISPPSPPLEYRAPEPRGGTNK
jgi:hypothetical protein